MSSTISHLIAPHGGELVNLIAQPKQAAELKAHSREWPSWDLTARQVCDLELLMSGGFSPLRGFMTRADTKAFARTCAWPAEFSGPCRSPSMSPRNSPRLLLRESKVALRDAEGVMLAVLNVEEVWQPDRKAEAEQVFETTSPAHPGVD